MKLFNWIERPWGQFPVQAEGTFLGYYFYFRSRWDFSEIEFAKTKEEWLDTTSGGVVHFYVKKYESQNAGSWIKHKYAKRLIYKGLFWFVLYKLRIKKHQH